MIRSPRPRQFLYLALILLFVTLGCSKEDQSTEKSSNADKTASADRTAEVNAKSPRKYMSQPHPAGFKKNYTSAIKSMKKEDYDSARENLMFAVQEKYEEQSDLEFNANRYGAYLPHYYLGQIAYLNRDCHAAMAHWKTSLAQKAVQETPVYEDLQDGMKECGYSN